MVARLSYAGEVPAGRELGDVVFSLTGAPDPTFYQANGQSLAGTGSRLGRKRGLVGPHSATVNDGETSVYACYPCIVAGVLYWMDRGTGAIKSKTTALGAVATVMAGPANYNSWTYGGFWYAGGKFWRSYYDTAFRLEYADAAAGPWTRAVTPPAAGGGPHTLIWSPTANRFYFLVQGGRPYQSTDGGVTWTTVAYFQTVGAGWHYLFDAGADGLWAIASGATVARSTDAGATWSAVTLTGNAQLNIAASNNSGGTGAPGGPVFFNPFTRRIYALDQSGNSYGIWSASVAIAAGASMAWAIDSAFQPGGSDPQSAGAYVDPVDGLTFLVGRTGSYYLWPTATWSSGAGSPGIATGATWHLIVFDGYLHVYAGQQYRPTLSDDIKTRHAAPTITALNGFTAYIKAK